MVAVLASFVLALPFQFAGVGGYFAVRTWFFSHQRPLRRRDLARYARAARTLGRAAAVCGPVAGIVLGVGTFSELLWPRINAYDGLRLIATAATVSGAWVAIQAGRDEARGRLRRARASVLLGGRTMFSGVVAELVLTGLRRVIEIDATEAAGVWSDTRGLVGITASGLIGLGGFVALLAALTGKPRPSMMFAVLLYVVGRLGGALLAGQWH